jgi:very-short-patch-repair endonuclease
VKIYDKAKTGAVLRARQLRRDSTEAEKRLWRALRSKLPGRKWRRQMPIGPYFADFACFAEKLIIELDGGQHASTEPYDERRTRFVEAQGFRLLRFWNNDVMNNTDGVLQTIGHFLSQREKGAKHREGEMEIRSSSPSQPSAGSLPLPMGEV